MIDFLIYLGSGKLLLFFAKKFPPIRHFMKSRELLSELYDCDLCFGFWFYLLLVPFSGVEINIKNKILKWIILACFSTYVAQTMSVGHEELFGKMVIMDGYTDRKET